MSANTTDAVAAGPGASSVTLPVAGARLRLIAQLAQVQARRILRSPVFLIGLVWLVLGMGFSLPDTPYHAYSAVTGSAAFLLGPFTFFTTNLVATSERRSNADDWTPALPLPERDRVSALLLACLAPAAVGLALTLALWWLTRYELTVAVPSWEHVASVPLVILGAATLGVAVSRLLPWTGSPMLVMVALIVFNMWVGGREPYLGFYVDYPEWTDADVVPAMLSGSAGWHLAYLGGYLGLAVSGSYLRSARRLWVPFATGAVSGVLMLTAAVLQLP